MDDRRTFLSRHLPRDTGAPLRVMAHSRILDGIRSGVLTPGSMVPTETELGQLMGVSRTVVREALMLLQEDGFLVARRGVGRFVADALPQAGLDRLRPLEELLATPAAPLTLNRSEATLQSRSATFVSEGLGIDADQPTWFFETVLLREGQPVALCQEHFPADVAQQTDGTDWAADHMRVQPGPVDSTLLALLLRCHGPALGPGALTLVPGTPGPSRAALLQAAPDDPALVMTHAVPLNGAPCYLAKHLVLAAAGPLSLLQTGQ